jgi:hypothetical protein
VAGPGRGVAARAALGRESGAIELGDRVVPRPSDAGIAAARSDVLAAPWGPSW